MREYVPVEPADISTRYQEKRFWSVQLGTDAVRLSMFDEHGGEHFCIIRQDGTGMRNRDDRNRALERLEQAMLAGRDPGEVDVSKEALHA